MRLPEGSGVGKHLLEWLASRVRREGGSARTDVDGVPVGLPGGAPDALTRP